MIASSTRVREVPKGKLRHCRDKTERAGSRLRSLTACAAAVGSPMCFPGEVMGVPILPDVLVGERCARPHGWCRAQLPRLSAAHGALMKPSLVVHRLVQEGRADSPQGATGCRDGANRRNSRKEKGPALPEDEGEIL